MKRILFIFSVALFLVGCGDNNGSDSFWDNEESWFISLQENAYNLVDVFYIPSTQVMSEYNENGEEIFRVLLTEEERVHLNKEMTYASNMFSDSLNFYSPYYHQFTLNLLNESDTTFQRVFDEVTEEVCEAFDYYMSNFNNNRKFILAGFSQGSMLVLELLKHMSDEQYSRFVAGYCIGDQLSEEDMAHPHIKAAQGESDTGVVISFTSVENTDAVSPMINGDSEACINPLNWRTDSTPAELHYNGDTAVVTVEQQYQTLLVKGLDLEEYRFAPLGEYCEIGNFHHFDILFYEESIGANAKKRAYSLK